MEKNERIACRISPARPFSNYPAAAVALIANLLARRDEKLSAGGYRPGPTGGVTAGGSCQGGRSC